MGYNIAGEIVEEPTPVEVYIRDAAFGAKIVGCGLYLTQPFHSKPTFNLLLAVNWNGWPSRESPNLAVEA